MLSAAEVLEAWEEGAARPVERALALLARVTPGATRERLLELPLGRRDALLLRLYAGAFGDRIDAEAPCPSCGERFEIRLTPSALAAAAGGGDAPETIEHEGHAVSFRLPNTADQLAASLALDVDEAKRILLRRCVIAASIGDRDVPADALPEPVQERIAEAMERRDPLAEIRLDVRCPSCARRAAVPFDIVDFLCHDVDRRARDLLGEVHVLASAYHWSETAILAMSPARRRHYLQLVGA